MATPIIDWDIEGLSKEEFLKLSESRKELIQELSVLALTEIEIKAKAKFPGAKFPANFVIRMGVDYIDLENGAYVKVLNSGRAPQAYSPTSGAKKVPIAALLEFVKERGIKMQGKTDLQVAFALQKSIATKGVKKKPYFNQAWTVIKKKATAIIDKHLTKILDGAVGVG